MKKLSNRDALTRMNESSSLVAPVQCYQGRGRFVLQCDNGYDFAWRGTRDAHSNTQL